MGFFSRLKEKVSKQYDKVSEKVSKTVEKTGDALRFNKIKSGLSKTRKSFLDKIGSLLGTGRKIDDNLLEELEEVMLTADIGVNTTEMIIENVRTIAKKEGFENAEDVYQLLKDEIHNILIKSPSSKSDAEYNIDDSKKPHVILVIGVNGVGKTTTIGKLARNYKVAGKEVVIGAADTFRAAANEQLEIWAQRADVEIIQKGQGADPASVAYDTVSHAINENKDVVLIDTAGRLHNKANLMQELGKISRVIKKKKADAPDEVFLVLDGTTGQNAILQAKEFTKAAPITGIVLTKLDGTAKGGVVIPIANELKIPVRYIGVGEKIDDLQPFDPDFFIEAMFGLDEKIEEESKEG